MWCASTPEREMCEWLIERGSEFEMHKTLANGRICDFYFEGLYWEMDGMDRTPEFFDEKYGDLPYVVVTPEDFRRVISTMLDEVLHVENGDPIVSIEPIGAGPTYDVEMDADGPLNFIANGIVSHNSHAACYALISYRTAYLKANYPAEYMAAVISSVMSTKDKVPFFVNKCDAMGIDVLPPDVNSSDHGFVVSGKSIRFGLDAVKNVGHAAVEAIIRARDGGRRLRVDLGLLRARRLPGGQQARDRVPRQVRSPRFDRRLAPRDARDPAAGTDRRARRRRRTLAAARARSSTSATPTVPEAAEGVSRHRATSSSPRASSSRASC